MAAEESLGQEPSSPPNTTAHGALLSHITGGANTDTFQPMNINFGLFPPPSDDLLRPVQANGKRKKLKGKDKKKVFSDRALQDLAAWKERIKSAA
jgi:methylenetetrahydrofolate--tRNA-(uracil-5-)-methyltransferase